MEITHEMLEQAIKKAIEELEGDYTEQVLKNALRLVLEHATKKQKI